MDNCWEQFVVYEINNKSLKSTSIIMYSTIAYEKTNVLA